MSNGESKPKTFPPIGWPGRVEFHMPTMLKEDLSTIDFPTQRDEWQPQVLPANLKESADTFQVTIELPGVKKEDVRITLENNILSISASRKFEDVREGYHRIERHYGTFMRSFSFPVAVLADQSEATLQEGVLTVKVKKADTAVEPREIPTIPVS